MSDNIVKIKSIHQLHEAMDLEKPKHPLISIIDAADVNIPESNIGIKFIPDLYMIAQKDKSCGVEYGRNHFDFEEGVMVYTAPKQVQVVTQMIKSGEIQGWMLFFHPDLIQGTGLNNQMEDYSFFNYEVFEALHLSEEEERLVNNCLENIRYEYQQRIDSHSQRVIVSNIELLLNYSLRFYERQFNTRKSQNVGVIAQFEKKLKQYFSKELYLENGIPSIQYFAEQVHLSAHYLSDLLKKETGSSAKDHINNLIIEKAKDLLLVGNHSVSEIAYELGFNYPHYFTRMFKSKTGKTPAEYRSLN